MNTHEILYSQFYQGLYEQVDHIESHRISCYLSCNHRSHKRYQQWSEMLLSTANPLLKRVDFFSSFPLRLNWGYWGEGLHRIKFVLTLFLQFWGCAQMLAEYLVDNHLTDHLEAVYRRFPLISESIGTQPIKRHYFSKSIIHYDKYNHKGRPRERKIQYWLYKGDNGKTVLNTNLNKVILAPRLFIILLLHYLSNLLQLLFLHQNFYFFP